MGNEWWSSRGQPLSACLLLVLTCGALVGQGCKKKGNEATPSASASSSVAPLPSRPRVKLIDAGAEPRRLLEVKPTVGAKQRVRLRTTSKATQLVDEKARDVSPAGREGVVTAVVTSVNPQGALVEFAYSHDDSTSDSELKQALSESKLRLLVVPDGTLIQAGAKGKGLKNATVRRLVMDVASLITEGAWPLPAEPVGKGAKWKVSFVQRGSLTVENQVQLELVQLSHTEARLKVMGKLNAPPQPYKMPELGSATMTLDEFSGTLEGERIILLDRPLFLGTVIANSRQKATATSKGKKHLVVTKTLATRVFEPADGKQPKAMSRGGAPGQE